MDKLIKEMQDNGLISIEKPHLQEHYNFDETKKLLENSFLQPDLEGNDFWGY